MHVKGKEKIVAALDIGYKICQLDLYKKEEESILGNIYIGKVKNNGTEYLRLVESIYSPRAKVGRKRTNLYVAPLSKFDDSYDCFNCCSYHPKQNCFF